MSDCRLIYTEFGASEEEYHPETCIALSTGSEHNVVAAAMLY